MNADWWNIVNAIAQSIGALGTTGALLVAALAYRRNVADLRVAQASRVVVEMLDETEPDGVSAIRVHNTSDLPIFAPDIVRPIKSWERPRHPVDGIAEEHELFIVWSNPLFSGIHKIVRPGEQVDVHQPQPTSGSLDGLLFEDSAGRLWVRWAVSGRLAPYRRRRSQRRRPLPSARQIRDRAPALRTQKPNSGR